MTREKARREIDSLDFYLQNHTDDYSEESHTAMVMAIKALEQQDRIAQILDDYDLLEAWEVLKMIKEEMKKMTKEENLVEIGVDIGDIKELPSVTPKKDGWIPCSERLPEYGEVVMCSCTNNGITISCITHKGVKPSKSVRFGQHSVIAWQPLPQPYTKGE